MTYKRIVGGDRNLKSGAKWSKEEIVQVYFLYKKLHGIGLHEHNPEIQLLAQNLGRTVRSTEAQALMFRNLERFGNYSHGNMNKISRQVWNEYQLKRDSQLALVFEDDQVLDKTQDFQNQDKVEYIIDASINSSDNISIENDTDVEIFNYDKWNKLLVDYYFNSKNDGKEIQCFLVNRESFEEISDFQFTYSDFELSIEMLMRSKSFKFKFNELYLSSIPRIVNGRNLRKPIPEYFGFLMYLILSLSESKCDNLSVANVYDRINDIGKKRFCNRWEDINTNFARDVLELAWKDLQDWSSNFKNKSLGYFIMREPKSPQRKYVSRIERHGVFNSRHFQQLFDVLIEEGITPHEEISPDIWLKIFKKYNHKISNANEVIGYLEEDSELKDIILKFINDYYQENFIDSSISSPSGTIRKPSIPLLFCLRELPKWDNKISREEIYFRAFSTELEEDVIKYENDIFNVEHEYKEYSRRIEFNWTPNAENLLLIEGDVQRFSINKSYKWLVLNRDLEEWIEVITPTNAENIILFINTVKFNLIQSVVNTECEIYDSPWSDHKFIEFENLAELNFKKLINVLGYKQSIEGKIELVGNFLLDRRRVILKEFTSYFKYHGPLANPQLIAKCASSGIVWELVKDTNHSEGLFRLSESIEENKQFFVYEKASNINSHFSYSIESVKHREIINITRPYSKDEDGLNIVGREIESNDIFDIPCNFNKKDFDTVKFNTWQNKLWKIFRPNVSDYVTNDKRNSTYSLEHNGEKLLNFLSIINNVDTYRFSTLIKELNPNVDTKFSKRIMHYWRDLGYINFESYGERIKVSPSNLLFIKTNKGLRAFLTGFRNRMFIQKLVEACKDLKLIIKFTNHSEVNKQILPIKIEIYDKLGDLDNFKTLAKKVGIQFINNIENPYNRSYAIYQLACFYTQRSVAEFDKHLNSKLEYKTDHHRKLVFEPKDLSWKETNKNVSDMEQPVLIRYDGFKDRQVIHIYREENESKILDNYALASFKLIKNNIFLRKRHNIRPVSDFYVPLSKSLPFWIERGLILMNAEIPNIEWIDNKVYRKYQNIHDDIITIIEDKLNQKAIIIN